MANAMVYGRVAWTHLPEVNQPEIAAEVADLLHRLERITWAFCTAETNNRLVISIRSSDPRARCGRLLKSAIGRDGNAGGHHHMAAGYLDLEDKSPEEAAALRVNLVQMLLAAIEKRSIRLSGSEAEPVGAHPLIASEEREQGESAPPS
jgi:nanoRNase/pAp phosphatase (c-di-AMP/oligoRNAs hydrolase)